MNFAAFSLVFEPDVAGAGQNALVFLAFLGNFLAPDLVYGLRELPNDVELVEDQDCLRSLGLDRLDVGRPHVAADTGKTGGPFGSEEVKERGEGVFGPFFTAPDEASRPQVIDIGQIYAT